MDQELAALKEAAEAEVRDEAAVRAHADAYVSAHPEMAASYSAMTIEQLVQAVDVFRAANMEYDLWRVEAWLLHRFEPQQIGGPAQAVVRTPGTVV